jgi:hypothetical protein
MPLALAFRRPALWRGGGTFAVGALGPSVTLAAYPWVGAILAIVIATVGFFAAVAALVALYYTSRPLRFKGLSVTLGIVALVVLFLVGVTAARDVAMAMVGTDAEAVVAKTWTTAAKGTPQHHCTLHHPDGTPIPRKLDSSCAGHETGDVIPIVLDPGGRLPPISGTKADLSTVGQLQVLAGAGLVLLLSTAIGSPPNRKRLRPVLSGTTSEQHDDRRTLEKP